MGTSLRCVLLDLGNVLVKIDLSRLGERIQSLTGISPDQLRRKFAADDLVFRYESGRMNDAEFHSELCRTLGRLLPWDDLVAAWNSIFLPKPILDNELLSQLAARADVWIISNTNPMHFEFLRHQYDFFRFFKGFVLSYEVGALKPDPAIFTAALDKSGSEAARTLFVDDQAVNVEAARSLGLQAFRFIDRLHFAEQLQSLGLL